MSVGKLSSDDDIGSCTNGFTTATRSASLYKDRLRHLYHGELHERVLDSFFGIASPLTERSQSVFDEQVPVNHNSRFVLPSCTVNEIVLKTRGPHLEWATTLQLDI